MGRLHDQVLGTLEYDLSRCMGAVELDKRYIRGDMCPVDNDWWPLSIHSRESPCPDKAIGVASTLTGLLGAEVAGSNPTVAFNLFSISRFSSVRLSEALIKTRSTASTPCMHG